jgi:NAD-dependent dihydropyrimidine dehydrogenase PreA subunit
LWGLLFRLFPLATGTGLRVFGNPDEESPVFITCNYDLTVKRVSRHLRGLDCYLLVAPTGGINVWCAAAGRGFTERSVISVLKTSGIAERVRHRKVILPQLAAAGVNTRAVEKETGWQCVFGPVYARDIPEYVRKGFKKREAMRRVHFNLWERLEVGMSCSAPGLLFGWSLVALFWKSRFFEIVLLSLFLFFLMYGLFLVTPGKKGYHKLFVWEGLILAAFLVHGLLKGSFAPGAVLFGAAFVITGLFGLDFGGISPLHRSDFDPLIGRFGVRGFGPVRWSGTERIAFLTGKLRLRLHRETCVGCGRCADICPVGVYYLDPAAGKVAMERPQACVGCGACPLQCPVAAIGFEPHTSSESG